MPKIKVAFIGAGYMSAEHLKAFAGVPGIELTGICSRTRSRAEKLAESYPGLRVFDTVGELYNDTRADMVVVSVPIPAVKEIAFQCFQYPWTCFFEKPLGMDLREAREINEACSDAGAKVYVLLNRRQYASTRTVLADLATLPGKRMIHVQDQEDVKVQQHNDQPQRLLDKWMYANAIHLIDYFCFLGRGEIISVNPVVKWNPDDPGYVIATINYSSGDIGLYQAVWNAPGPWAVAVNTPSKRWEMKPLEQASWQEYGSRKINPADAHEWDTQFKPGLRQQAEQAVRAFRGLANSLATIGDAMVTMQLVHDIYGI